MAENADVLIQVGALPDVASAKEAGRKIREIIEAEVSKFAGGTLKGQKGAKGVISAISGLSGTTGVDTYYKAAESRYALRNVSRKGLTAAQRAELREMDRELGIIENVARRSSINEPINRTFAETRLRSKIDTSLQTLNKGLTPNFAEVYRAAEKSGDTKKLAALDRQIAIKTKAAGVVLSNPEDVTNEQFGAATATKKVVSELKSNTKALNSLTKVGNVALGIAGALAREGAQLYATEKRIGWQERVDRSFWGSQTARAKEKQAEGAFLGGGLGAVVGGIIGTIIAPGVGTAIGAGLGGSIGGTLGSLPGEADEARIKSYQKTIADTQNRFKNFYLYGDKYSTNVANAIQETGMASTGDVQKMAHNASTLRGRMMLGQISNEDMLMYQFMPEYFNAIMSGANQEEIMRAYANDMSRLPEDLQLTVAEQVGGGSAGMYALSKSGMLNQMSPEFFRQMTSLDSAMLIAGKGFLYGGLERGWVDANKSFMGQRVDIERATQKRGAKGSFGIFSPLHDLEYESLLGSLLYDPRTYRHYSSNQDVERTEYWMNGNLQMGYDKNKEAVKQTINIYTGTGEKIGTYENEISKNQGSYTSVISLGQ